MNDFITCDIGKKITHVYNPKTRNFFEISTDDFIKLNIPELVSGCDIILEDAHLRSQEDDSLAQTWTIDKLRELRNRADAMNVEILCFPQKVTPKARKILSLENPDVIEKTDKNDIQAIAYYLKNFPGAYNSLKVFNPVEYAVFEERNSHIYADRDALTEDSNTARNEQYGIGTDYKDAVTEWIKKYIAKLAFNLDEETREWSKLKLNANKSALLPGIRNYTSKDLKFIYGVVNTILNPNTGEPRVRSDINKVPHWKYAKQVYFGLTPYHMHAGVTASNYKYHKRKAGSLCKKSMSLESKNAIKSLDDVLEIREAMKDSDRKLRTLWRTVRKMIVEDGLR